MRNQNLCFEQNKKKNIKLWFKGVYITRTCFTDEESSLVSSMEQHINNKHTKTSNIKVSPLNYLYLVVVGDFRLKVL